MSSVNFQVAYPNPVTQVVIFGNLNAHTYSKSDFVTNGCVVGSIIVPVQVSGSSVVPVPVSGSGSTTGVPSTENDISVSFTVVFPNLSLHFT
ncbi:MAG: hypothetical protein GY827_03455 [Cytophagales bacterium]|nr:hypothetical protein [Cytophagales bacterium]